MEEELSSSSYFHLENYTLSSPNNVSNISNESSLDETQQSTTGMTETTNVKNQGLSMNELRKRRKLLQKEKLSKITKESTIKAEKRLLLRNNSIRLIQQTWKKHHKHKINKQLSRWKIYQWIKRWTHRRKLLKIVESVLLIQKRWRLHRLDCEQKIARKFSQDGRWSLRTSHLIFGLILGHRTRLRMKNSTIIFKARRSLHDAWTVLEGLVTDGKNSVRKYTVEQLIFITIHSPQSMKSIETIDWPFARMFVKEVLASRGIIWHQMIGIRQWCRLPAPGYWYYSSEKSKTIKSKVSSSDSTSVEEISKNRDISYEADNVMIAKDLEKRPSNPQSLAEILKAKGKNIQDPRSKLSNEKIDDSLPTSTQTLEAHRIRDRDISYSKRPATAPSHVNNPIPTPSVAPMISAPRRRKLHSSKPHLQIDVISADKLAPVKGKPIGGVTDRKPGFRVHLFLPTKYVPGGDPDHTLNSVKMNQSYNYDSIVETLFPVWNQSVYLNLPIPPGVEQNERLSESLLHDYWSHGYVKIEVVDGERFHEEIFLGEACLFLSALLNDCQRRDQNPSTSNIRSMGGSLPLCKRNPIDRVTGTVNAIGYLHMALPETFEQNEVTVQKKITTPGRKISGEKGTPENNSNSMNSLTPPSSSKRLNQCQTPTSASASTSTAAAASSINEMKTTPQRVTPTSEGLSASERRRRKNTPPIVPHTSVHEDNFDEISHITPKYTHISDSSSLKSFPPAASLDLPSISSGHHNLHSSTITPTASRPSTAPDRRNRIAEQLNKLESLANTLQYDAESAVQSLNRKLLDRIEEKNEIPVVSSLSQSPSPPPPPHPLHPPSSSAAPNYRENEKIADHYNPSQNRKITLVSKVSNNSTTTTAATATATATATNSSQLEDADVLLANLRRRLIEKNKIVK